MVCFVQMCFVFFQIYVILENLDEMEFSASTETSIFKICQIVEEKTGSFPKQIWYKDERFDQNGFQKKLKNLGVKHGETLSLVAPVGLL